MAAVLPAQQGFFLFCDMPDKTPVPITADQKQGFNLAQPLYNFL